MGLSDDLILLGKVSGTHGIRGELKISCYSGEFDTLLGLHSLLLRGVGGDLVEVELASARIHSGKAIVKLKRVESINDVAHLTGREVVVDRSQLPQAEADEYYWHDLIGLRVLLEDGSELGTLSDIFATGSNDVYVVKSKNREYLIPATEDVVQDIDLTAGVMTITPLEGLLDL